MSFELYKAKTDAINDFPCLCRRIKLINRLKEATNWITAIMKAASQFMQYVRYRTIYV